MVSLMFISFNFSGDFQLRANGNAFPGDPFMPITVAYQLRLGDDGLGDGGLTTLSARLVPAGDP
jgi:hypothetical protein